MHGCRDQQKKIKGFTKRGGLPAGLAPPTLSGASGVEYFMVGIMSSWRRQSDPTVSRQSCQPGQSKEAANPYLPPAARQTANQHLTPGQTANGNWFTEESWKDN